jgi:Ca2+-binding EF-hand superfamily protein
MSQQAAGCHVKKVDGRVGGLTGGQDTESHIIVRSEFVFESLDADSDGWITEKEYRAAFDVLDSDHDGRVSRDEFGHASYALFDMLDVDKDGKLSRHEYEAGFPLMDLDCDGRICKRDLNTFAAPRIWRGDAGDKAGDR